MIFARLFTNLFITSSQEKEIKVIVLFRNKSNTFSVFKEFLSNKSYAKNLLNVYNLRIEG